MRKIIEISDEMAIKAGCYSEDDILLEGDGYASYMAAESNEIGCFEILNITYENGHVILNDGFSLTFMLEQLEQYSYYINEVIDEAPMYYIELQRRNGGMDDTMTYNYAESFMYMIYDIIAWALLNDEYMEVE